MGLRAVRYANRLSLGPRYPKQPQPPPSFRQGLPEPSGQGVGPDGDTQQRPAHGDVPLRRPLGGFVTTMGVRALRRNRCASLPLSTSYAHCAHSSAWARRGILLLGPGDPPSGRAGAPPFSRRSGRDCRNPVAREWGRRYRSPEVSREQRPSRIPPKPPWVQLHRRLIYRLEKIKP